MYQLLFLYFCCSSAQLQNITEVSFVYLTHDQKLDKVLTNLVEENSDINLKMSSIQVSKEMEFLDKSLICASNPSIIFDATSNIFHHINQETIDIPYIKVPSLIESLLHGPVRRFITESGKNDAYICIQNDDPKDRIELSIDALAPLRVFLNQDLRTLSIRHAYSHPIPSFIVIVASTDTMNSMQDYNFQGAKAYQDRLIFCFTDFSVDKYRYKELLSKTNHIFLDPSQCCKWNFLEENCTCPEGNPSKMFQTYHLHKASSSFINTLRDLDFPETYSNCTNEVELKEFFNNSYRQPLDVQFFSKNQKVESFGDLPKQRRLFNIGIWESPPWAYVERDPETDRVIRKYGKPSWGGFCVDIINQLSELMDFDYELVQVKDVAIVPNRREGNTAELYERKVDFIVADLRVSSRLENFLDFISPPFSSSGFQIIIRKVPEESESMFQFFNVLRPEVWYCVGFAAGSTALLIWLLDNYSPVNYISVYSVQKRKFTLRESVWFALTSFTPQGCGEAPKYPSGRLLFTSYWFFVILIVTVFTANLSAFLTVERMNVPLKSLEELSKQKKIKILVQENQSAHKYFNRMCEIENEIFNVYKNSVLLPDEDRKEFRTWEYPVRYMYRDLADAINSVPQLKDLDEILELVRTTNVAFVHDSAQVEYDLTKNCNLMKIGDAFAIQPLAVATQSGSYLKEELTAAMFTLQEAHLFEALTAKYWNYSNYKGECLQSEEDKAISIESLGGLFIAVLGGMVLSVYYMVNDTCEKRRKVGPSEVVKPVVAVTMKPEVNNKIKHILSKIN